MLGKEPSMPPLRQEFFTSNTEGRLTNIAVAGRFRINPKTAYQLTKAAQIERPDRFLDTRVPTALEAECDQPIWFKMWRSVYAATACG